MPKREAIAVNLAHRMTHLYMFGTETINPGCFALVAASTAVLFRKRRSIMIIQLICTTMTPYSCPLAHSIVRAWHHRVRSRLNLSSPSPGRQSSLYDSRGHLENVVLPRCQ